MLEINEGDDVNDALEEFRARFHCEPGIILSGIPRRQYEPDWPRATPLSDTPAR